jgi:multidrug resistance efflux pump
MNRKIMVCATAGFLALAAGCRKAEPVAAGAVEQAKAVKNQELTADRSSQVRATGTIRAIQAYTVQVPRIAGLPGGPGGGRVTLVKLTPNGSRVAGGDVLAEFDRTSQLDAGREAQAKFEDLSHQVKQKAAQNRSDAEKRSAELKEAEAELAKAQIQLRKGPVLSEIDRLKNEERAQAATAKVASLKKIHLAKSKAEAAALRILELQRERQKVALERAQLNMEKLVIKSPITGMVALENLWRGGSMGNAQEGDQLFPGQPLLKIFDPSRMAVQTLIGEPDGAVLREGTTAMVYLDAYPDAKFVAKFHSASPVATSAMGSPIKNFAATFHIEQSDTRLLPDLSAAVIIQREEKQP